MTPNVKYLRCVIFIPGILIDEVYTEVYSQAEVSLVLATFWACNTSYIPIQIGRFMEENSGFGYREDFFCHQDWRLLANLLKTKCLGSDLLPTRKNSSTFFGLLSRQTRRVCLKREISIWCWRRLCAGNWTARNGRIFSIICSAEATKSC